VHGLLPERDLIVVAVGARLGAGVRRLAPGRRADRDLLGGLDVGLAALPEERADRVLDGGVAGQRLVDPDLLEREVAAVRRDDQRVGLEAIALGGALGALVLARRIAATWPRT
jgi:hypothetical protein